jgi:hypothetical protein
MRPHPLTAVIAAAIVVAVGGALFGSRPALVVGSLVALLVLAGHPLVSATPRPTRLLLRIGLAGLAGAVVVTVQRWTTDQQWSPADLRNLWQRPLALAILQLAACVCFGVAVARAPRERLRGQGPALLAVGLLALAGGALNEAQTAWRNRPHFDDTALVAIAVRTTGPALDLDGALTVGVLLIGAALTVLACARLAGRSLP